MAGGAVVVGTGTGTGSEIGTAVAAALAEAEYGLALWGRNPTRWCPFDW